MQREWRDNVQRSLLAIKRTDVNTNVVEARDVTHLIHKYMNIIYQRPDVV